MLTIISSNIFWEIKNVIHLSKLDYENDIYYCKKIFDDDACHKENKLSKILHNSFYHNNNNGAQYLNMFVQIDFLSVYT